MIGVVAEGRRRDEVGRRNRAIGRRIQFGDGAARRVDVRVRNHRIRERLSRRRIARRRQQALGKVAVPLRLGRHVGYPGDSFAAPGMFVVGEEKHAILRNGTTNRSSGLFAVVGGRGFVTRREEIPRVERTRSKESIQGSMECIASRPCDHMYLSGAIATEGRVVAAGGHAKLLNSIDRKPDAGRVEFGIDVIDAVEQKTLRVFAAAIGSQREVPTE